MAAVCFDPLILGTQVNNIVQIVDAVINDPALPQIISLVQEIQDMETGPSSGNPGGPGLGLDGFVAPLKGYIFVKRHPIVTALLGVSVLALPFAVGYAVGRR